MSRLGIRRPRVAGRPPAGLIGKASGYSGYATGATTLPGGATIPAGSQVTDATNMLGALHARTATGVNGSVPLPRDEQFWALMGPGSPLYPNPLNIPNQATGQADPRRWQYPVSWNLTQDTGRMVDWSTLRDAASSVDLIAQCIRVRRTEQSALEWDITLSRRTIEANGITSTQDKAKLLAKYSADISRLIDFWSTPDTTNGFSWPEWLEQLLQEQLVTDAVSIYPRFTYGGDLVSLELIDGATVKPLLDERGNRPQAPAPAFQQWLYGFPRGEYTATDGQDPDWQGTAGSLLYKPRYTRVESPYGYSPVEQALVSAELWLRRQQWMVAEYTQGTAPRTFLKSNLAAYTPEQIRAWEDSLNDFYGGSTTNRHRIRLLPEGFDPSMADDAAERYKPDYDEFLVKLVCAHMDVQPQEIGFTPRNGLGGAGHGESQEAITYRKALRPTAQWLVNLMNQISYTFLGMSRDLTFQFLGLDSEDLDAADQTTDRKFRSGRMTLNETRDEAGLSRYDFPEADMPMIVSQRGVVFLENASELAPAGEEITPVQAPPITGPPEGNDAQPDNREQAAPEDTAEEQVKKAELVAYWRWAGKGRRGRPFEFAHVTKTEAMLNDVDLGRVVFKAGDAGPKAPGGQTWPGWERDLEVARHWAPRITAAVTKVVDARAVAAQWLAVRKAVDTTDARHWLHDHQPALYAALTGVLTDLYTEGYLVGDRAADAMVTDTDISWDYWTPGNPEVAQALLGEDMGLRQLLADAQVTITSIADHRLDDLAQVLADGRVAGSSVDDLAAAIADLLDNPRWAMTIAVTETSRAVSYAAQQAYRAAGIELNAWITVAGACVICDGNTEHGPVPVGDVFPSGDAAPPAHPTCRCALAPIG